MADLADIAFDISAEFVALGLAAIAADLPAGVAGECEECGEQMPRLVGGRCGFCRDGRRPPLSFYADRADAPLAPVSTKEEKVMTTQPDVRNFTIQARGELRAAVEQRAAAEDLSFGRVALDFALAGLHASLAPTPVGPALVEFDGTKASAADLLGNIPDNWLVEEVARRISGGVSNDDHDAAIARAEIAEQKLASMKALLTA